MKRTISLLLVLAVVLALVPAVRADVLWIPEDPFLNKHMGDCRTHERGYYAAGPDGRVTVYKSPETNIVEKTLENGTYVWISWEYTDSSGNVWGFCEHYDEDFATDWTGWMPLGHMLLRYDSMAFQAEFAQRITEESGVPEDAEGSSVVFWDYPGSDSVNASLVIESDYLPEYHSVFTDDAGRKWGHVGYYMGIRNVWICLDNPTADYDTLYADAPPQQVTHPTMDGTPVEIKPAGPNMTVVLLAVCAVAVLSGGFLWATRKKK